jgi:hypothetical protein
MKTLLATTALALAFAASSAFAGPLAVGNPVLGSGGLSTAYYVGHEAADTDTVMLTMGGSVIFDNKTTPVGTSQVLGTFVAGSEIEFTLKDLTIPDTWYTGPGSRNSDGDVHADVTGNPASIPGFGTLSAASQAYAISLEAPDVTFVGFEDRPARSIDGVPPADWDYNDLVFAVLSASPASHHTTGVAEPSAFALLGMALIMLGYGSYARRRALERREVRALFRR